MKNRNQRQPCDGQKRKLRFLEILTIKIFVFSEVIIQEWQIRVTRKIKIFITFYFIFNSN